MAGAFNPLAFQNSAFQTAASPPVPIPSFGGGGGGGGGSAGYTRPFVTNRDHFTPTKAEKKKRKKERKIIRAELAQMMDILAPHQMSAPTAPVRHGSLLNPQIPHSQLVTDEEEEEVAMLLLAA